MSVSFKSKLAKRETTVLLNPDYPHGAVVEFVGGLGVDAIMIDCEQGSASLEAVAEMARAARLAGIAALVRIPSPEPWTIERHMFLGVHGVVVPRLESAAQVRRVLQDIRYCFPKTFDDKIVIIQIECGSIIAELDEIISIPGIDCFFIGSVDLSKSLGFDGDYSGAEMISSIEGIARRLSAANKSVGMLVKPHDVRDWRSRGATMLYTHLNDFIELGARRWRERADLLT